MAKNSSNVLALGVGLNLDPLNQDIATAAKTAKEGMNAVAQSVVDAGSKSDKPLRETKDKLISLSAQLRQARLDAQQLSIGGKELGDAFQASVSKAAALKDQIAAVDNAIISNSTNIQNQGQPAFKNATNGYNGMAMSINQLTREMPAFTYSMQTGFMAISNNIPMFVDQINMAKKANMELMSTGQPVKSVFSQVASSIFSFQTLMGVGITVLTVYGAEIIKFATGLFTANEEVEKINKSMRTQIITIETLRGLTKDYLNLYEQGLTGKELALAQQRNKHQEDLNKITENTIKLQKEEEITGVKNIIGRNIIYFSMIASAKRNKEAIDKINKDFNKKELAETKTHLEATQKVYGEYINSTSIQNQFAGGGQMNLPTLNAPSAPTKTGLNQNETIAFKIKQEADNARVAMLKAKVMMMEAGEQLNEGIRQSLENGLVNSLSGIGKIIGETITGNIQDPFAALGQVLLQSIGGVMTQLGTQMIALGVGMLALDLGIKTLNPFVAIAGGIALAAAGAAISSIASKGTQGGTSSSISVSAPANFSGANGSNYLGGNNSGNIVINGMIKGNDIQLVNGRNDRKFNRSLRFG